MEFMDMTRGYPRITGTGFVFRIEYSEAILGLFSCPLSLLPPLANHRTQQRHRVHPQPRRVPRMALFPMIRFHSIVPLL
jgi:hypothetical protein